MNFWIGFFSVFQGFDTYAWGVAYAWLTLALTLFGLVGSILKIWLWFLNRKLRVLRGRVQ